MPIEQTKLEKLFEDIAWKEKFARIKRIVKELHGPKTTAKKEIK